MQPATTATPPPAIDVEWLAQYCYIQFAHEDQDYWKGNRQKNELKEEQNEDRIISYRTCEVCRRSRPDWMMFHCYMNNGKDRQTMTMCMQQCYYDYQQKRYELLGSGKPTGVIAIAARTRVEDLVMSTLRKVSVSDGNDYDGHNDDNDSDLFCEAVALTYDQSPAVREYFHNDRSRIRPNNGRLWPIRYQAFKEYGT